MNVRFVEITKAKFNQLTTKDDGALYVVKDGNKRELWKGNYLITKSSASDATFKFGDIYTSGDYLETPASGTSDTYMVIMNTASDEGLVGMSIGGNFSLMSSQNLGYANTVIISNLNGDLFVIGSLNLDRLSANVPDLYFESDYAMLVKIEVLG